MIVLQFTLAVIWLGLLVCATWSSLRKYITQLTVAEKIATTLIISILCSSWFSFGLWYVLGTKWGTLMLSCIACLLILRDRHWYRTAYKRISYRRLTASLKQHRFSSVLLLVTIGFFAILSESTMLPVRAGSWYSSGPSWGDMMLHLTLASRFVESGVRDLVLPIFPSSKLTYPFLIDLHAAQLFVITNSWQVSFGLPSVMLLSSLAVVLYRIAWRLGGSRFSSILWPILIFGSGSAAGIISYVQDFGTKLPSFADYANLGATRPETQQFFANITTAQLLPQRSYLIGVCIALTILLLIITAYKEPTSKIIISNERRLLYTIGVLVGLLPLIHIHTFLVISLLLTGILVRRWYIHGAMPTTWLRAAGIALVLASPQIIWQLQTNITENFSRWRLGWLTAPQSNPLTFWFINLGILLPVIIATGITLWRQAQSDNWQRYLFLVGLVLFVACNVYIFQPNPWDNMKFLSYAYIFLTLPVAMYADRVVEGSAARRIIIMIVAIIVLTPGTLSLIRQIKVSDELFRPGDIKVANFVQTHTAPDSRFLIVPRHNNPIVSLAGRTTPLGYTGWLWTYGIDYARTQELEQQILRGERQADAAITDLQIDYIVLSDAEQLEIGVSQSALDRRYLTIYRSEGWTIYQLTK